MKKTALALALLGLLQAPAARAAPDPQLEQLLALSLEDLLTLKVAISTQTPLAVSKAPSVVSVITAEDIKATGATNLVEVLQSVPGVYVRVNQFGLRPLISLRGASGPHVLLMVNGAPIRDLVWNAGIFWKGLTTAAIERIEIIRGPGSALYGSDASSGVINVITRTAQKFDGGEAGLRAGSYNSREAWAALGASRDGLDIALTAQLGRTDGPRPYIDADRQTASDRTAGTSLSYAPGQAETGWDSRDLRLAIGKGHWRFLADHVGHGNLATSFTGAGVLDPRTRGNDRRDNAALLYDNAQWAPSWGVNAELRYQRVAYSSGEGFQERPPGYQGWSEGQLNRMRSSERRWTGELGGLYTGAPDHALRIGMGYVWQDLYSVEQQVNFGKGPAGTNLPANSPLVSLSDTPYAFAPEKTRIIRYAYAQDVWSFARDWELTAGARFDKYSDFGTTVNPRLALVWQANAHFTAKLMYGEAFRAPNFLELYAVTAATTPNPALRPERSRTWDLALTLVPTTQLSLGLNLFQFEQSDLIGQDATGRYQNAGDHRTTGAEFEARWQATPTLRLSGSYTRRQQQNSPYRQFNIPDEEGYLRADWSFLPRWNWNLQANHAGRRDRAAGDTRAPVEAATVVDTTLRYAPRRGWEFAASIRNLFDVDAREYTTTSIPNDLPLPRRSAYAEVRYKF